MAEPLNLAHATVVFLHAHPDDEAIFTGGTVRMLADAGCRVVLVLATSGQHGVVDHLDRAGRDLGTHRLYETDEAARLLGVSDIIHLGYEDSGMDGANERGFASVDSQEAAGEAAELIRSERLEADAIVIYDDAGIYGHADHVAVHGVGLALAEKLGVERVYEATVDREYLHFVETHVVVEAGLPERPHDLGLAATTLGRPTVLIDTELDVSAVLEVKRAAMAAHQSQIPESSSAMQLSAASFSDVYGMEWYVRHGPPGPIETLAHGVSEQ